MSASIRIKILGGTDIEQAYSDCKQVAFAFGGIAVETTFNGVEMFYHGQSRKEWVDEIRRKRGVGYVQYAFNPLEAEKAKKSKAPDPTSYALEGLKRDPAIMRMAEKSAVGNEAKLREAAQAFVRAYQLDDELANIEETSRAYEMARAALAAPPRNCDVGTAEYQAERYRFYCESHKDPESECLKCPLFGITGGHCELAWAQLPYEESEVAK